MTGRQPFMPASTHCDNQVEQVFVEGDDLYTDMLGAIDSARESVTLEVYIFSVDEVGQHFVEALSRAAERGVRTRVLVDAFGSLGVLPARVRARLRAAGVHLRRFHRWRWREPWRYNRRDHRKLLVVDGCHAWFGGFNLHRECSRAVFGELRWRDTHVRVGGALAAAAAESFECLWQPPRRSGIWQTASGRLISNHHSRARGDMRRAIYRLVTRARSHLWVTTPYFVPDHALQRHLVAAARRGVVAHLLVPGKNDVRLARWASHAAYAPLLAAGVRIFEYRERMLHAKTVVADGTEVMVGTANLDYRSLRHNIELALFSQSPRLCCALETAFAADCGNAQEITATRWHQRAWTHYIAEAIGWSARQWL